MFSGSGLREISVGEIVILIVIPRSSAAIGCAVAMFDYVSM